MDKPPVLAQFADLNRACDHECGAADTGTRPGWADAEMRAFLERPDNSPAFAKILQVILITAMAVAAVRIAWIIFFHA